MGKRRLVQRQSVRLLPDALLLGEHQVQPARYELANSPRSHAKPARVTRLPLLITTEKLTGEQQIEADARRIVGYSPADN